MSDRFIDPFLAIYPTIDLHGETSEMAPILVKNFITENYLMEKEKVIVIHGRHGGIVKKSVHAYLKADKRVKKYYVYGMNDGVTVVELEHK